MIDPVGRLRGICLALPDVSERASHGEPCFFAGLSKSARQFVAVDDHHHAADHLAFWSPAAPGVQEALLAQHPERFFRPPYVGHRGWIGMRIDNEPDWDEVAEVVADGYRCVAPAKLVAILDSSD